MAINEEKTETTEKRENMQDTEQKSTELTKEEIIDFTKNIMLG